MNDRSADDENGRAGEEGSSLIHAGDNVINIQNCAGVVDQTEIERLRRFIFRSSKGKCFMYSEEFRDQDVADQKGRSVYIIVFWDGKNMRERIQKICDSFRGQRYELPSLAGIKQ